MGQGTIDPMRPVRMGQLRRPRPCRHRWVRLDNPMQVVHQRATTPILDYHMELTTLWHEHETRPKLPAKTRNRASIGKLFG